MNLENKSSLTNDCDLILKIIAFCLKEGKVAARQIAREFNLSRKRATQIVRLLESYKICLKSDKKNTPCQFPCAVTAMGDNQTTPSTSEPNNSLSELFTTRDESSPYGKLNRDSVFNPVTKLCSNLNEIINENKSPYPDKSWKNVLNITPTGYYDDAGYYLSELIDNFNDRSTYQKKQGWRKTSKDFFKESGMFRYDAFSEEYKPIIKFPVRVTFNSILQVYLQARSSLELFIARRGSVFILKNPIISFLLVMTIKSRQNIFRG